MSLWFIINRIHHYTTDISLYSALFMIHYTGRRNAKNKPAMAQKCF